MDRKQNAKIDLRIDAMQLFFALVDGQYKADLRVGVLQKSKLKGDLRRYAFSYPDEGFEQAAKFKILLSITTLVPKNSDIRILIVQRIGQRPMYGIQSVKIQP
jgi:hypothetical protein